MLPAPPTGTALHARDGFKKAAAHCGRAEGGPGCRSCLGGARSFCEVLRIAASASAPSVLAPPWADRPSGDFEGGGSPNRQSSR
eukprot:12261878-Alexandrium_andersonii.AAC.1